MEGRAESLPFPDNYLDFLSMGYALRHISDLGVAFAEFERVLKPGGRLCILLHYPGAKPPGAMAAKRQYAWGHTAADTPRLQAKRHRDDLALLLGQHRSLRSSHTSHGHPQRSGVHASGAAP